MPRIRLIALLLVLVTLAVYFPVVAHGFVFDDGDYLVNNRVVQQGLTWTGIRWAFTTWHSSNWHPLTWISHMLDCELFGPAPGPAHIVNVLFHLANTILLLVLLARLTGALWPSALVAALFAWHPLHVESVAWLAERKDVLSTFFGLLTLLAYAGYVREFKVQSSRFKVYYCLALVFYVFGLMSKPMVVTLPFVMLLLDCWPLRRGAERGVRRGGASKLGGRPSQPLPFMRLIWEKTPFFLLAAASCVVTVAAQGHGEAIRTLDQVPLSYRLENVPVAYGLYLFKTIYPAKLAVYYPMSQEIPALALVISLVVLGAVSLAVWLGRKRCPYLLVGWLWFLGTLVPVTGLVQAGSQALADRYTYFPLIGIFIAVAFGLGDAAGRFHWSKNIMVGAATLGLGVCIVLTERQLTYWRDNKSLFLHAIAVTKDNALAHLYTGMAWQDEGNLSEALTEYRESARLAPHFLFTHFTMGGLLDRMKKPEEALEEYRRAAQIKPRVPAVHDRIGIVLVELDRADEGIQEFKNATELDPSDPWPHFHLGKVLASEGRDAMAAVEFREALRLEPDDFQILALTAQLLSASRDPQAREGQAALGYALKANMLTGNNQPFVLDTLGMAYAETGQFDEAQRAVTAAIELVERGVPGNAPSLRSRLELYKNHQPWRESFQREERK